jgi:predicted transcriptional regulator
MPKNTPYTGPVYTIVPNKAFDALVSNGHGGSDVLIYHALCRHYNFEKDSCWPSINTIAKTAGVSSKNVGRSLNALCCSGLVVREKNKSNLGDYDRNVYYLPHYVAYQVEDILKEKTSAKNKKRIKQLKELQLTLFNAIEEFRGTLKLKVPTINKKEPAINKSEGTFKDGGEVPSGSPTNTTINNTTINITKNVTAKETKNNEDLTSGLKQLKRYNKEFSQPSTEAIGDISTLIKFKREGLVQQLANDLNDEKSIPFFRSIVSKFTDHEDTIYKCLSLTRETQELAGIRKSRGAVFTDHIKREAEKLGIEL